MDPFSNPTPFSCISHSTCSFSEFAKIHCSSAQAACPPWRGPARGPASGAIGPRSARTLLLGSPGLHGAVRPGQRSGDVLSWVRSGELTLRVERPFPLPYAAEVRRQLEGRATTSKLLLIL